MAGHKSIGPISAKDKAEYNTMFKEHEKETKAIEALVGILIERQKKADLKKNEWWKNVLEKHGINNARTVDYNPETGMIIILEELRR